MCIYLIDTLPLNDCSNLQVPHGEYGYFGGVSRPSIRKSESQAPEAVEAPGTNPALCKLHVKVRRNCEKRPRPSTKHCFLKVLIYLAEEKAEKR